MDALRRQLLCIVFDEKLGHTGVGPAVHAALLGAPSWFELPMPAGSAA